MTPHQLITQTRLAAASHRLRETDRSVAELALHCGFYDHSAFPRAFRSVTGLTPTQFRSLQKEQPEFFQAATAEMERERGLAVQALVYQAAARFSPLPCVQSVPEPHR
jgi:AraC-like DNA-binding protein